MLKKLFFLVFFGVNILNLSAQDNNTWVEKNFSFKNFLAIAGGYYDNDGNEINFIDNLTYELREPISIKILYENSNSIKEIVINYNWNGGQNINIHLCIENNIGGNYILQTKASRGSVALFDNCTGIFEWYILADDNTKIEFVLYSEIARTENNIYIAFQIDSSILFDK